jgi:hypothetical protein
MNEFQSDSPIKSSCVELSSSSKIVLRFIAQTNYRSEFDSLHRIGGDHQLDELSIDLRFLYLLQPEQPPRVQITTRALRRDVPL